MLKRRGFFDCCACCGLPFASVTGSDPASDMLAKFQKEYMKVYSTATGLYDVPQNAHVIHDWGDTMIGLSKKNPTDFPKTTDEDQINASESLKGIHCMSNYSEFKKRMQTRKLLKDSSNRDFISEFINEKYPTCSRCNSMMTCQKEVYEILRVAISPSIPTPRFVDLQKNYIFATAKKHRMPLTYKISSQFATCRWFWITCVLNLQITASLRKLYYFHSPETQNAEPAKALPGTDYFRMRGVVCFYISLMCYFQLKTFLGLQFTYSFAEFHIFFFEELARTTVASSRMMIDELVMGDDFMKHLPSLDDVSDKIIYILDGFFYKEGFVWDENERNMQTNLLNIIACESKHEYGCELLKDYYQKIFRNSGYDKEIRARFVQARIRLWARENVAAIDSLDTVTFMRALGPTAFFQRMLNVARACWRWRLVTKLKGMIQDLERSEDNH